METLSFSIKINAPKEKVWNVLLEDKTYRVWTAEFSPGSHAVTDWQEGSKTLFLGANGNGMVSTIVKNMHNEFLSIKHLGNVKDGAEDFDSEEAKEWSGAMENYTLKQTDGVTELKVDMDIADRYNDYFSKTWPKALKKVKELSEK